jgi:hypothetical protein
VPKSTRRLPRFPRLDCYFSRDSVLCNQHHAEACFAFHHAGVSLSGLFERNYLDHRANIQLQFAGHMREVRRLTNHDVGLSVNRPDLAEVCYQIRQKFSRTIFCPSWQPKARLNSSMATSGNSTSICPASASVDSLKNFFRMTKPTMIAAKAATTSKTDNNTETLR